MFCTQAASVGQRQPPATVAAAAADPPMPFGCQSPFVGVALANSAHGDIVPGDAAAANAPLLALIRLSRRPSRLRWSAFLPFFSLLFSIICCFLVLLSFCFFLRSNGSPRTATSAKPSGFRRASAWASQRAPSRCCDRQSLRPGQRRHPCCCRRRRPTGSRARLDFAPPRWAPPRRPRQRPRVPWTRLQHSSPLRSSRWRSRSPRRRSAPSPSRTGPASSSRRRRSLRRWPCARRLRPMSRSRRPPPSR